MKNRYESTCKVLEAKGWSYDHDALYNGYCYSGTVSKMRQKAGYEYARVHVGHCYGRGYQLTLVYKRPLEV